MFSKISPKFTKNQKSFNDIDILEDTKMLHFSTFSEISRSYVGFTDSDIVTA